MNMSKPILLKTASIDGPLQSLYDELKDVIAQPKYDRVTVAALIGVLEMLKHRHLHRSADD